MLPHDKAQEAGSSAWANREVKGGEGAPEGPENGEAPVGLGTSLRGIHLLQPTNGARTQQPCAGGRDPGLEPPVLLWVPGLGPPSRGDTAGSRWVREKPPALCLSPSCPRVSSPGAHQALPLQPPASWCTQTPHPHLLGPPPRHGEIWLRFLMQAQLGLRNLAGPFSGR